jgi:RHS repeat-associated protein
VRHLIAYVLLTGTLQANQLKESPHVKESVESIIETQENHFVHSQKDSLSPQVDPFTGALSLHQTDLTIHGAQPLHLARSFSSFSPKEDRTGNWFFLHRSFLGGNLENTQLNSFLSIGTQFGGVVPLFKESESIWTGSAEKGNWLNMSRVGKRHPDHIQLSYSKHVDPKNTNRFVIHGSIKEGDGSERFFRSRMHSWNAPVTKIVRKAGILFSGSIYKYAISPLNWTPYQIPIIEERLSNGNWLIYTYQEWRENTLYPRPPLLKSVRAYDRNKELELGSLTFEYTIKKVPSSLMQWENSLEKVTAFRVTGSDGREVCYQCEDDLLKEVRLPSTETIVYTYDSLDRLVSCKKQDSTLYSITYDAEGRVISLVEKGKGETRWIYKEGKTHLFDAEQKETVYTFNKKGHLTHIEWLDGKKCLLTKTERWNSYGNLEEERWLDQQGHLIQKKEYEYDKNHNITCEALSNGNERDTTTYSYSEDGFNTLKTKRDALGREWRYTYLPKTDLCTAELFYSKGTLLKRKFFTYNTMGVCIEEIEDDGQLESKDDLSTVRCRFIKKIKPKENFPCLGLPERVEEWTQEPTQQQHFLGMTTYLYAAHGAVRSKRLYDSRKKEVSNQENFYNHQERLIAEVDPEGHKIEYGYDKQGRVTTILGPLPDQKKELTYNELDLPVQIEETYPQVPPMTLRKEYSPTGLLLCEQSCSGLWTHYTYDRFGNCIQTTLPNDGIYKTSFSSMGHLMTQTDPLGETTAYHYNVRGQVTQVLHPDGRIEKWKYDEVGRETLFIDALGTQHKKEYDAFDHLVRSTVVDLTGTVLKESSSQYSPFFLLSQTDPGGLTTSFHYDPTGALVEERSFDRCIKREYDGWGNIAIEVSGGVATHFQYNRKRECVRKERRSEEGRLHSWENTLYDALGNITSKQNPDGEWIYTFTPFGGPLKKRDPLGQETTYQYFWEGGERVLERSPKGVVTETLYTENHHPLRICKKDPQGNLIACEERTYDLCDRLLIHTFYILPGERKAEHKWYYGPGGRLKSFIEYGRKPISYFYTKGGLLKEETKPDGRSIYREYDGLGRVTHLYGSNLDYQFTYDGKDRILEIRNALSQTTTHRSYTLHGELESERLETGATFDSTYDVYGRRERLHLPDTSTIETTFREGRFHSLRRLETTFVQERYDPSGRPSLAFLPLKKGRLQTTWDSLGRLEKAKSPFYHYESPLFDGHGNLLSYKEESQTHHFQYDFLDQLLNETDHTYTYDSINNRTQCDGITCQIDQANQLIKNKTQSFQYDENGNLIQRGEWHFSYDLLDRLTTAKNGKKVYRYTYDGLNRRLSTQIEIDGQSHHKQTYLWDDQEEIGQEDYQGKLTHLKVCDPAGYARIIEIQGKPYVPIEDFRGNIVKLLSDQEIAEESNFSAFGIELSKSDPINPWRFCGKRCDEESGLVYFGKRYYIPEQGRWLTADPIGLKDGPNRYAYLHNHPLTAHDLEGLWERPLWTKEIWGEMENVKGSSVIDFSLSNLLPFKKEGKFEAFFKEKSFRYVSHSGKPQTFQSIQAYKGISFVNGMRTTLREAFEHTDYISSFSNGYPVHGIYNATHGALADFLESRAQLHWGLTTEPVKALTQFFKDYFAEKGKEATLLHISHSQGAIITRNALRQTPEEIRSRIHLLNIAPGGYTHPNHCGTTRSYSVKNRDFVPYLDVMGRRANAGHCYLLSPHPDAPLFDHDFRSPSFSETLETEIKKYIHG